MNKSDLLPCHPETLSGWILTFRPKTLTATLIPFCAGAALAYANGATIIWGLLLSALASGLCIQTATNLINDSFDTSRGADTENRLGPRRAIQQGLATQRQIYLLGLLFFVIAFIVGVPLILHGGMPIAAIIGISCLVGYAYTGGPFPLAYHGLGDLFVILFFGWISTLASYWLQTGELTFEGVLLGTQIGLLSTALIAINNLRDVEGDTLANKKTLPVRFGVRLGKIELVVLVLAPFGLNLLWLHAGYAFAAFLPLLTLPLAILLVGRVWNTRPSRAYNDFLALAALLHLSFGTLMSLALLLHSEG